MSSSSTMGRSAETGSAPTTWRQLKNMVGVPPAPTSPACGLVGGDALLAARGGDGGLEAAHVEADLLGPGLVGGRRELGLGGEHLVVHLPELALLARRLGGQRGRPGVRVEGERLVLPDHPDLAREGLLELLERRLDAGAEGALEVREEDHRDLGVGRAAGRVVGADRHLAVDGGRRGGRRGRGLRGGRRAGAAASFGRAGAGSMTTRGGAPWP